MSFLQLSFTPIAILCGAINISDTKVLAIKNTPIINCLWVIWLISSLLSLNYKSVFFKICEVIKWKKESLAYKSILNI